VFSFHFTPQALQRRVSPKASTMERMRGTGNGGDRADGRNENDERLMAVSSPGALRMLIALLIWRQRRRKRNPHHRLTRNQPEMSSHLGMTDYILRIANNTRTPVNEKRPCFRNGSCRFSPPHTVSEGEIDTNQKRECHRLTLYCPLPRSNVDFKRAIATTKSRNSWPTLLMPIK
jgi:hypothetical protein